MLGAQFADGRRSMTSDRNGMPAPNDLDGEQAVVLAFGNSSGNTYDVTLWMSPLPPPGPVTIVCRWPELDIDETKVTLDGRRSPQLVTPSSNCGRQKLLSRQPQSRRAPATRRRLVRRTELTTQGRSGSHNPGMLHAAEKGRTPRRLTTTLRR